jgi:hypothetical protein
MADFTKRKLHALQMRTVRGITGTTYLVLRGAQGDFHVFTEVEAKEAARDCGTEERPHDTTRTMWERVWRREPLA